MKKQKRKGEQKMYNEYHVNANSFGSILPFNWETIADYLNNKIDELDEYGDKATNEIWEAYWNGEFKDAPKAISSENTDEELLKVLDDASSWNDDYVEGVARELCERTGISFDAYEDYDSLFDALEKAIKG